MRCALEKWRQDLQIVHKIKFDRCYKPADFGDLSSAQLRLFLDASTAGYGQANYLRLENTEGRIHCSLVMEKEVKSCPCKTSYCATFGAYGC